MTFLVHFTAGKVPASEVIFIRALSGVIVLLPFVTRHRVEWISKSATSIWTCGLVGSISVFCFAWNLQHTSVAFANTLFNLAPIAVVCIGTIVGQKKIGANRLLDVILVISASALFWHGSQSEISPMVWVVGLLGMCAAAIAYAILKILPFSWNTFDVTWSLSVATLPVALLFKQGPWVVPGGAAIVTLIAICALSIAGGAFLNVSFRYVELSTATSLVPSAIIWGVLIDTFEHNHPAWQAIAGCALYLLAMVLMMVDKPAVPGDISAVENVEISATAEQAGE